MVGIPSGVFFFKLVNINLLLNVCYMVGSSQAHLVSGGQGRDKGKGKLGIRALPPSLL